MELPRFPIVSVPLCIPVSDSASEDPFRCSTTPLIVQRPTQLEVTRHAPKNDNLMNSGSLGQCDDPDCLDCPNNKMRLQRTSVLFDSKVRFQS
jgi:cyclic nucleotide gated channel